ncbi:hypothetical protein ACWGI9_10850 [Streptomyces sp. NPDC054833]
MTHPTNIDENAPVVADHTIRIATPVERVWLLHSGIGSWPGWQPAITEARLDGPIAPGTTSHWVTAGLSIDSTNYAVDAPHRILWGGPAHGITGVHEGPSRRTATASWSAPGNPGRARRSTPTGTASPPRWTTRSAPDSTP